jgi:hypothetical protein
MLEHYLHTNAAEAIDGEGVASSARANIGTNCISTGMFTEM